MVLKPKMASFQSAADVSHAPVCFQLLSFATLLVSKVKKLYNGIAVAPLESTTEFAWT